MNRKQVPEETHLTTEESEGVDKDNDSKKSEDYAYNFSQTLPSSGQAQAHTTRLILDSASSVNIISNPDLLHSIKELNQQEWIPIMTIGKEVVQLRHQGMLGDYLDPVWHYPKGTANILSLSCLQ